MARSDWISVGISKKIIEELDEFLKTEEAQKIGVSNRQQILSLLLKRFLENRSINTDTKITNQMYKIENEILNIHEKLEQHERVLKDVKENDVHSVHLEENKLVQEGKVKGEFIELNFNDKELKQLQKKYGTSNSQELQRKIRETIDGVIENKPMKKIPKIITSKK